jgi:hypothetical protein
VVRFPAEAKYFLFSPQRPDQFRSPPGLLPNKYRGFLPRGIKWPGREANHSPPTSAKITNEWNYTFTPPVSNFIQGQYNFTSGIHVVNPTGKFDSSHLWQRFPQVTALTRDLVGYFVEKPYNLTGKILTIIHFNTYFIPGKR